MENLRVCRIAALYIRVSTDRQEELSPESQKRLLLEYASAHQMEAPERFIYTENGISGRKADKRPKFQQMIATAKSPGHPFDVILLWKFSRFARNQEESIVYKSMLRNKYQVEVVSISEPLVEGPFGSLIERIIEWMDEFYSIRLSGDVMRGMTEKAMRGGCQCCPPLGYRIPYHSAPVQVVPEEAQTVRLIFDKYVREGMSLYSLCRYVNGLGLKTARGKPFEKRSLEYILTNPFYAGYIRWNRRESSTGSLKDQSQWIFRQGSHPPLVSRETFDQAAKRCRQEHRTRGGRPAQYSRHWLSGLVKCSVCGRTLSACARPRKDGKIGYIFQCYGYLKGKCGHNSYVAEKEIGPAILEALGEWELPCPIRCGFAPQGESDHEEASLLRAGLRKLEEKERRLREAYEGGVDTLEEYRQGRLSLKTQRRQMEDTLQELESSKGPSELSAAGRRAVITGIRSLAESALFTDQEKNAALKNCVDRIVYNREDSHLDLYFYLNPSSRTDTLDLPG